MHPPMLFISYASLVITAAACVFMLRKREKVYDDIAYRYAKIGYILLTTGMLIGYPWAIEAWKDSAWWWDPKISGSIMMWVLYSAYLHARIYSGRMWSATACLGIICFASLVFTYLLTYIVPGIHSVVQP
jgi:ABC-type transport system involved in cytochrome c biogenesis permease subunit